MPELKKVEGVIVDAVQLGKLLDCTREHVSRLHKVHGMPKASRGRFDLVECVRWYCDYIRASKRVGSDERERKNSVLDQQKLRLEIENKTKLGELLPAEEVAAKFNAAMSICASQLDAMGPRLAPRVASIDSVAECQKVIFDESRSIRRATSAALEALAVIADGGGDTDTATQPQRRRVGRRRARTAS